MDQQRFQIFYNSHLPPDTSRPYPACPSIKRYTEMLHVSASADELNEVAMSIAAIGAKTEPRDDFAISPSSAISFADARNGNTSISVFNMEANALGVSFVAASVGGLSHCRARNLSRPTLVATFQSGRGETATKSFN